MRLLIAGQLVVIVAAGLFAAARVAVFSDRGFGDEPAHFDYVRMVAQDQRLPVLERDKTSEPVAALRKGLDPDSATDVERPAGLAGEQYEAFQPPPYHLVAAPVFGLSGTGFGRCDSCARSASSSCWWRRRCCTTSRAGPPGRHI